MTTSNNTHSLLIGYVLWLFGFLGAHRFYYGRKISGLIYFFTGGLFGIGWVVDLFLMPSLDRKADVMYTSGKFDYTVAWVLHTFFGMFGLHRFYLGRWKTGLLWLCTVGLFGVGWLFDFWRMNDMVDQANRAG
jgi:TM2 domain-containing membrane protein YozV